MKIEYLRHEYTWSSQCITGTKVGWGITASSTPLDKERLVELEKLAAGTVSDPENQVPIESLVYSPASGFTKMVTIPNYDGEDGRKNKTVHIYQVAEMVHMTPEGYLTPGDTWDDEKIGDYYAPIQEEMLDENVEDILIKMGCYDRLPDYLQVVLEVLLGERKNMNIVADWPEEDFAKNSKKFMYAVHSMIPESLRKKACYQSFSRGEASTSAFYFSREPIGKEYMKLGEPLHIDSKKQDELKLFFYQRLAESYVKKDTFYPDIMDKIDFYYTQRSTESHTLRKLYWILCALCIKEGEYPLSDEYISREIPKLFYWCDEDSELRAAIKIILEYFHTRPFTSNEQMAYQASLVQAYTKRSEKWVGSEMSWSMQHLKKQRVDLFKQQLKKIQQKNNNVYTLILTQNVEDKDHFAGQMFEESSETFEQLRSYLLTMNMECANEEFKDLCLVQGIELLNEDLFYENNYKAFDDLVKRLGRQEQGAEILKNFIAQLQNLRTSLDDERLSVGCFVEELLNEYEKSDKYNLLQKERAARQIKEAPTLSADAVRENTHVNTKEVTEETVFTNEEVEAEEKRRKKREEKEERRKEKEKVEEAKERKIRKRQQREESFFVFLLRTLPMGFITGALGFVLQYSMKIGHGKIGIGMLGIWVILMIDKLADLQTKQRTIRTWQTLGLCITEGVIVAVVGWRMVLMQWHLRYFIILGVITVLFALNNLLQERENRLHR